MYDVWDVIGLRGTGTDSYSVENLFIPEKFAALRDEPQAAARTGRCTSSPPTWCSAWGFAGTSLGVARATLDAAIDLARGKTPQAQKAMRENNAVQGVIGRTEATCAPRAPISTTAAEVWRDLLRDGRITEAHRIALRIAATWSIHQSAAVVDTAYHMAGATAVFNANRSNAAFATCTPSRSRSRAATRITRTSARRSCRAISSDRRRAVIATVVLRTGDAPLLNNS
jgi:alkylation response protein AidB-like acyl-CoA dehydrogenase